MCRWMQIMNIMWFAPDTPVVSVEQRSDGVHKVSFRNVGRLCVMLKTAGSRFLLHFNETHLMCCRIARLDGVMTCYIMDTCAVELKHHVPVMLEVLHACQVLPDMIRYAIVDETCEQQKRKMGGCVCMSLLNLTLQNASVSFLDGEKYRETFVLHNRKKINQGSYPAVTYYHVFANIFLCLRHLHCLVHFYTGDLTSIDMETWNKVCTPFTVH